MPLEHRNGRSYYHHSRRIGKRVRKEYAGSGEAAALMQKFDEMERDEKDFAAWQKKKELSEWQERCALVRKAIARANRCVADALRSSGWHQHRREWRRRRGATMATDLATVMGTWVPGELAKQAGTLPDGVAQKAAKGDRTVLPAVHQYLDNPAAVALWGDPGSIVLQRWVELYGRGDLLVEQAMIRRIQVLREGLTGPNPTALDAILAERAVLAWVVLSVLELWQASSFEMVFGKNATGTARHTVIEVLPRHIDHAHRQLMAACRTLAKVRRSKLPDLLALVNVNTAA